MSALVDKHDAPPAGWLRRTGASLAAWLTLPLRPRRARDVARLPPTRHLVIGLILAIIGVGAAMWLADWRAVLFVRTLPPLLVDTFNELTDFGKSSWFLYPLAGLIVAGAVLATPAAGRMANLVIMSLAVRFWFVFLAVALPGLFVTTVKRLIGRLRPNDAGPFVYVPGSWSAAYASMPSGHVTTAVGAAIAIGMLWPRSRWIMWIYAVIIAASRVIIQAHYVSDTIAAAFVAAFGVVLIRNAFAARGLLFAVEPDGRVAAMPGPSLRRIKTVARRLMGQ